MCSPILHLKYPTHLSIDPKNIWNMFVKSPYWASIVNDLTLAILDFEHSLYVYILGQYALIYFIDPV